MNSRRVVLCLGALSSALLAVPAGASAKTAPPVIKSINPLSVSVGEKLTVKGSGFIPGKGKTRVFFVRKGGGTAFARAASASTTKLVVVVPAQLDKVLAGKTARVQLRVLTKKFGKLSPRLKSPVVSPSTGGDGTITDPGSSDPGQTGPAAPGGDCDQDGVLNQDETDMDNDLLTNDQEKSLALDPCSKDTDGDGVGDGYEYLSALDLNRTVLFGDRPPTPYPGKRPYPNPLDSQDANIDFDGDGLSLSQEHALWVAFGDNSPELNYSDGLQTTVPTPAPTTDPLLLQLDTASGGYHAGDGQLDDGERDADGDGLSNWDEANGRMTPGWWEAEYAKEPKETPYPVKFAGTNMVDPDTDGDGVLDGADDQDHDGLSNQFEVARPWNWLATYVSTAYDGTNNGTFPANPYARVQPFNPCKPVYSATCHLHPPFEYYGEHEDWAGITPAQAGAPGDTPGPLFAP